MSPSDIGVFEALAAIFTLSFILLVFFIWRFLRKLDPARAREAARRRAPGRLERGAVQFRVHGGEAPSQGESLSEPGR
jgi:hypothetical protein